MDVEQVGEKLIDRRSRDQYWPTTPETFVSALSAVAARVGRWMGRAISVQESGYVPSQSSVPLSRQNFEKCRDQHSEFCALAVQVGFTFAWFPVFLRDIILLCSQAAAPGEGFSSMIQSMFKDLICDTQYGLRILRKRPTFSLVAILSLSLGIGAVSGIFSLFNGIVLRTLHVKAPEELVAIYGVTRTGHEDGILLQMVEDITKRQSTFSGAFGYSGDSVLPTGIGAVLTPTDVAFVTGSYYSVLGIAPAEGRLIGEGDAGTHGTGGEHVAVVSHQFFRRWQNEKTAVVGQKLFVQGIPFTIIGVTPEKFSGLDLGVPADVTLPVSAQPEIARTMTGSAPDPVGVEYMVARLKPGINIAQAKAQLESLWPALKAENVPAGLSAEDRSEFMAERPEVRSIARGFSYLRTRFLKPLLLLMGIAALMLFITCINLANLLLAQSAVRAHEFGVRAALGANRWRIIRQLLAESVILSIAGAVLGLPTAIWGSQWLAHSVASRIYSVPTSVDVGVDWRVFCFAGIVTLVTGAVFGLAPLWRGAIETSGVGLCHSGSYAATKAGRVGRTLIVLQVSLSVVLLASAGLLVRSFTSVHSLDPGFRIKGILVAVLAPRPGSLPNKDSGSYYRTLVEQLSTLPGVQSASLSYMSPGANYSRRESVTSNQTAGSNVSLKAELGIVSPEFFRTMGIELLQGHNFTWSDTERSPRVCILTKRLSQMLFPVGQAVGQHIQIGDSPKDQAFEVIGVSSDVAIHDVRARQPFGVFVPFLQNLERARPASVELHSVGDSLAVQKSLSDVLDALGQEYPLRVRTLEQQMTMALLQDTILAIISGFFGVAAVLLVSVGLFGLMSYIVSQRTREIGIRMALGARQAGVTWSVIYNSLMLNTIGVALGLPLALICRRLIASQIYGLSLDDAWTTCGAATLLTVVAVLAALGPALRAARVEPVTALRHS